eukprot:3031232-Rhodomonas_salina.1
MWRRVYYESLAAWNAKGVPELCVRAPGAIPRSVEPGVSIMDALHVMWGAQARYDQSEVAGWERRSKSD